MFSRLKRLSVPLILIYGIAAAHAVQASDANPRSSSTPASSPTADMESEPLLDPDAVPATSTSDDFVPTPGSHEALPPSGLGATTEGERVVLYNDHTWKVDEYNRQHDITAVTDHGRTVILHRKIDPTTSRPYLSWRYSDRSGGPIEVLISRAIDTERSEHSKTDNCIPVVTVRNLTRLGVFRIIVELEFTAKDGSKASTSVMLGPLDDGDEGEKVASPLLVDQCRGLTAKLHVGHCAFSDGLDCTSTVRASHYGAIPLDMAKSDNSDQ